jgi:hypothetical protein
MVDPHVSADRRIVARVNGIKTGSDVSMRVIIGNSWHSLIEGNCHCRSGEKMYRFS